tara:strand:+ start:211 stop:420 length:210 start_codon:yes stop_codon:yes gene_type:complete
MSDKKISSFEKIGYVKTLPVNADINNYESITIKNKSGEKIKLYRYRFDREEIDDTSNFSSSWDVFNSLL